ncbi:MFS transporter [Schleiferilactobacillus perolens]|uniref:Major facilitator superfamily protein n=1 Tax=Schleiferilactobacillus perolens DSM 12744 TaxID=1423792 RepID=A0A0R1N9T3_9LACO|nr:MFS transporter [Schleiferilactobacillus perolens]KRL13707.1 major facilitator superfamily protein [Schleiferilactobacillus perolens DSM 12744]
MATPTTWRFNFYRMWTGQFLSGITSQIVQYALLWYLTVETKSATMISLATIIGFLPGIFISPFVGPIIDRHNKKWLMIGTDMLTALAALVLAVIGFVGHSFPLWMVFLAMFVRSLAQTFQYPTLQSITPTLVPMDMLTKISGQIGAFQSVQMIIAPAVAGVLFGAFNINYVILLDVIGAIFGSATMLITKLPERRKQDGPIHFWQDMAAGWALLRRDRGIFQLTLIGAVFTLIFMPAGAVYPLMTTQYFRGTVPMASVVEVVFSVGMMLGGIWIGWRGAGKNRIYALFGSILSVAISGIFSGILSRDFTGFVLFNILNFFFGLGVPFFNAPFMAMIQERFAPEMLGRIIGLTSMLMNLAGPLGLVAAGPIADRFGVNMLFIIMGVGSLLVGASMLLLPAVRHIDDHPGTPLNREKSDFDS